MTSGAVHVDAVPLGSILPWRDAYRREMDCQIIHDSLHTRPGWTQEYRLAIGDQTVGYGSVAIAGPWRDVPAVYELYLAPPSRLYLFELAERLLRTSGAPAIEVQSNDPLGLFLVHAFGRDVHAEALLFEDAAVTEHAVDGAAWRHPTADEAPGVPEEDRAWRGIIEVDGAIAASGGVMFHYNPPYGDIYMEVAEPFRRRGLGTLMVQELKRLCREHGFIPAARCNPANAASRRTLQRAGFAPCGHILSGRVSLP
jgi:GNAT superfamily N-acetyltransferase